MDRDKRWDRVSSAPMPPWQTAKRAVCRGTGKRRSATPMRAINRRTNSFLPRWWRAMAGACSTAIRGALFQFPCRPGAQNVSALLDPGFRRFSAQANAKRFAAAVGMTHYSDALADRGMGTIFPPTPLTHHPGPGRCQCRPHAVAHGGNREISRSDVFSEWRARRRPNKAGRIASWWHRRRSRRTICNRRCRRRN